MTFLRFLLLQRLLNCLKRGLQSKKTETVKGKIQNRIKKANSRKKNTVLKGRIYKSGWSSIGKVWNGCGKWTKALWTPEWGNAKKWAAGKGYELTEPWINSIAFLVLWERCNENEYPAPCLRYLFEVVPRRLPEERNKADPPPNPPQNSATNFERLPAATNLTLEL